METKKWFFAVMLVLSIIFIFFVAIKLNSFTGELILDSSDFSVNSPLHGNLALTIEQGDSLNKDIVILVAISRESIMLNVSTITLEEFVRLSGSPEQPVKKEEKYFYEKPTTFKVPIEKILPFTFSEKGEYELLFSIIDLNINKKEIIVI